MKRRDRLPRKEHVGRFQTPKSTSPSAEHGIWAYAPDPLISLKFTSGFPQACSFRAPEGRTELAAAGRSAGLRSPAARAPGVQLCAISQLPPGATRTLTPRAGGPLQLPHASEGRFVFLFLLRLEYFQHLFNLTLSQSFVIVHFRIKTHRNELVSLMRSPRGKGPCLSYPSIHSTQHSAWHSVSAS